MTNTKTAVPTGTNNSPSIEGRGLNSHFSRFNFTKSILFILIAFSVLLLLSGSAMAANRNIATLTDFENIGDRLGAGGPYSGWAMDDIYTLTGDITINQTTWTSIGTNAVPFNGTLNGNGKTITFGSNVSGTSSVAEIQTRGLFGAVNNATFNGVNVTVNNTTLNMTEAYSGVIAGRLLGGSKVSFTNCHVNFIGSAASINTDKNYVGGLIGLGFNATTPAELTITDCTVSGGSITATSIIGGLVASVDKVTIDNSSVSIDLNGVSSIGGFIGSTSAGNIGTEITNSKFNGILSSTLSTGGSYGGLIGDIGNTTGTTKITNCTSTSTISVAGSYVGGLIGQARGTVTIDKCTVQDSAFSGYQCIGGLVGRSNNLSNILDSKVNNCTITSSAVTSTAPIVGSFAGGLMGTALNWSNFTNSSFNGTITGNASYVGGIIGSSPGSTILNCSSEGELSGSDRVGGLVGTVGTTSTVVSQSSISSSYSTANCSATGGAEGHGLVGGLIGQIGGTYPTTISECYATGSVQGPVAVGGLVGLINANNIVIKDCYSTSSVSAFRLSTPKRLADGFSAGGLIGHIRTSNGSVITADIINCYAAGQSVSAEVKGAGGLIGNLYDMNDGIATHATVNIRDSYSLVGSVSAPTEAGKIIGLIDPIMSGAAADYSNVYVWGGIRVSDGISNDSSLIGADLKTVSKNQVFNTFPTGWTGIATPIWRASSTSYGLPLLSWQTNEPSMSPMNKGDNNRKGTGSATVSGNNTTTPPIPSENDTPPIPPGNDISLIPSENGTPTRNDDNIPSEPPKISIWWCIIAFVVLIAGVAVYFVKFRGKDY